MCHFGTNIKCFISAHYTLLEVIYVRLRIKDVREDKDLNQEDVAKAIGIPRSTYCNYESGRRNIPNQVLFDLANYFNVSIDYLLGRTD